MAMSLRYRTIFILGLLLLVLAGLFSALFYHFGTEQFSVVEQRVAERFARHSLATVNDELAAMDLLTRDWANWDDTYAFIEDLNPAYIRSNLTDETFANLHLNLMLFVRTSGEVAFARAYDLEAGEEMPIPQSVYDALPILTGTLSPGTGQQGVLLLPEGVLLVTARPILTSREEGPARGTLVFSRFLSDDLVARIGTHLGTSAAIYRWDRPEDWPADLRRVSASLSPTRPVLARPLNEEQIAGYALLTDLYGNPALVLTVVEERDIYLRFLFALRLFMVNVAIMGLLFAGVVTLLLDRLVLARLAALAAEVRAIGAQGNSGRAVTVRGGDELAGLAEAINDMLAAIEQARREREEREARLSRLAENSPDVIYRLAFSPPRLEYVSPAITRLLGYPPEDFYTYPRLLFRLAHPEDRRLLWAALRAELPPEEPLILRWINRNGETVWAEHRHTVVRDREGRAVAVEGIARDITERKRADAEIAQLNAVLRAVRNVNQIIAREKDRGKLLQSVCEELVNTRGYNAAWVVLTDGAPHIAAAAGEIRRAPPDLLRRWEENILPLQVRWVYDRPDALLVKPGDASPFLHRDPPSNGMLVRIAYAGKIYGILYAILPATQEFSPEEQSLFAEVAGDIAFALYSLEQEEAIRRHAAQLEAIRQAGLDLTAQLDLDVLLHSIIRRAVELVGGSAGGLYLYRPEEDVLEWVVSIGPHQPPIGTRLRRGEGGLSRRVWETGQPFWVDDYQHWEGRAPKYADYPWTAVIGIPVRWREEFQGVLIVQADPPRTFSAADADLLTLFATHAAVALANARLFASAEGERTRLDFLYRLGQRLSGTLDAFAIAQEALDALCRAIAADKGVVYLYEPTDARLRLIAVSGYSEQSVEAIDRRLQLRLGQGLSGWVALHHQTTVVDDVLHDERWLLVPGMDEEARAAISTPILARGERIGVMTVHSEKPAAFTPEDGQLMEAAASVIGAALLNARLYEAEQARARRLALVNQVAAELSALQEPEAVYRRVVEQIAHAFAYDYVGLMLMDDARGDLVFVAGAGIWADLTPKGFRQKLDEGMIGWVARHGETLLANDVSREPRYIAPYLTETRAELDVPLKYYGQVVGVLTVQSRRLNAFSPLDVLVLEALAGHIAAAIVNARLFEQERRARERTEALYRIGQIVNSTLDPDAILDRLTEEAVQATGATHGSVLVPDPERGIFERRSMRCYSAQERERARSQPLSLTEGINSTVYRTRVTYYIPDVREDPDYFPLIPTTRSELVIPLLRGDRILGHLDLQSPQVDAFRNVDMEFLRALADQVAIALENARLYQEERRRSQEQEVLALIVTALNTLDVRRAFPVLVHGLRALTECDRVAVALLEEDGAHFRITVLETPVPVLEAGTVQPLSTTPVWEDILAGNPRFCPDMGAEVEYEIVRILYDAGFRSYVSLPLRVGGRVIGALHVVSLRERHFRQEQVRLLQQVADALAGAIENERLYRAEREQRELAHALAESAAVITRTLDPTQMLEQIIGQVARVVPGDAFNVMLVEDGSARVVRWRGYEQFGAEERIAAAVFPIADLRNLREMVQTGEPVLIPDTHADPTWVRLRGLEWVRSYVAAPVVIRGITVGFLNVDGTRPYQFGSADAARLKAFADQVAIALENARLYTELRQYAGALEEQVRERTAQLAAQYTQLEAILRSTGDGIILTNSQGEILQANPVAQKWLAHNWAPEDARKLQEAIRRVARRAQEQPREILELPGLDLEIRASPVEGPGGEGAAVVILHDVTQFKTLERLRTRFISNISHELRTPLTTIKTYLHLLRGMPELLPEYLDVLEREVDWQARLVEDVLEISRLDSGALQMHFGPVGLNPLTAEVVDAQRPLALSQGLALECHLAEEGPVARADPDSLRMVLINLIRNSIQYTPSGGRVEVTTGEEEWEGCRWATVTVADTGIGIPKDELPYIFDRFFRGERPRQMQIPGTGLGLSIVKEVVDRHGGRIMVESEEGKGTRFTCWLPVAEEEPPMMDAERGTTNNTG